MDEQPVYTIYAGIFIEASTKNDIVWERIEKTNFIRVKENHPELTRANLKFRPTCQGGTLTEIPVRGKIIHPKDRYRIKAPMLPSLKNSQRHNRKNYLVF